MREDRCILGSSAHVPDMRRYTLLRQLAKSARHQARARHESSGHRIRTAGRALVVLLPGRRIF
jgi:hypothetical protein